ncbi:MAG: MauE/DoxX family redox-associated membrane protein [Acidobacteriota bacterium]
MESLTISPGQRALRFAGLAGAFVLGAVLLLAAYAKAIDPSAFAEQIHGDGLDRFLSAPLLALFAIGVEVLLGSLLVLEVRRLWVLVPAAALVAFFLLLTGRAYWQFVHGTLPADANCGCFGNLIERTPAQAFWQDAALLVPALVLSFFGRVRGASRFPVARSVLAAALTTAAVAFARVAPTLPLDDLATRLKSGVAINEICAGAKADRVCFGSVLPEIEQGRHLLVLADLTAPAFIAEVDTLNAYAQGGRGPKLWVLSGGTAEVTRAFFWKNGPAFEIREVPQALLRPLYRKLPRAFLVESGRVTRTWSGLPPFDELGEAVRLAVAEKGSS